MLTSARASAHLLRDFSASLADRALHPIRRRRAITLLRSTPTPRSVVFVCNGNLYRSPFAAACLRSSLARDVLPYVRITSAGFTSPGRTAPASALLCAERYNIDLQHHRSQLIAALAVGEWDLFVVMDPSFGAALRRRYRLEPERVLVLGDLDPEPIPRRTVTDPYNRPPDVLESAYSRINRCTRVLAGLLSTR